MEKEERKKKQGPFVRHLVTLLRRVIAEGCDHTSVHLWVGLLGLMNERRWPPTLEMSDRALASMFSMSAKTLEEARRELVARGIITFHTEGAGRSTKQVYALVEDDDDEDAPAPRSADKKARKKAPAARNVDKSVRKDAPTPRNADKSVRKTAANADGNASELQTNVRKNALRDNKNQKKDKREKDILLSEVPWNDDDDFFSLFWKMVGIQ